MSTGEVSWRATGPYLSLLASKSSLLEETRLFFAAYARLGALEQTKQEFVDSLLPQRSRQTRETILKILRVRFLRWNPPAWVLDDLAAFAQDSHSDTFHFVVLLHSARQDHLLYDFIQQVVVPNWQQGIHKIIRSDVQSFLDTSLEEHPEILHWSHETRQKIARNTLTVLRDCKLLKGEVNKCIVLPHIPILAVQHLIRLLYAEGISIEQMAQHPDWQLWLWDSEQARQAIEVYTQQESTR